METTRGGTEKGKQGEGPQARDVVGFLLLGLALLALDADERAEMALAKSSARSSSSRYSIAFAPPRSVRAGTAKPARHLRRKT